ncbi:MAG TPA: DUF739 family protein [Caproiciproducens sp.]|nr:DUF739 family protein [Caproiciproducens sp.]
MYQTVSFDFSRLLGLLKEKGIRQEDLAHGIKRNPGTLSAKLNNQGSFTAFEINAICDLLDIPKQDIGIYFFTPKFRNSNLSA